MIPSVPTKDTVSSAERRMFEKFSDLPGFDDWVCLHSLRLSKADYAHCGEIDFLLIGPQGVFVCEVKGGGVSFDGTSWRHQNRHGHVNYSDRGPMKQAEQAMFSLMKNLKGTSYESTSRDVLFGWFVVFPDINFDVKSSEWNGAEVLDQTSVQSPAELATSLIKMMRFWSSSLDGKSRRKSEITADQLEELAEHWRPLFDRSPSLKNMVLTAVDSSNALTTEQYRVISFVDGNPRLICEGGAGTGKSFIALEIARRRRDSGQSVLLTAKNPPLLAFLSQQPDLDGIDLIAYDEVRLSGRRWDYVIIDEAQDVLIKGNPLGLDDWVLKGVSEGSWMVCVDPATQTGFYGDFDVGQYSDLLDKSAKLTLRDNCRNTGNIVTQMGMVLGREAESGLLSAGPPVLWTPPLEDISAEARALEAFLRKVLIQQGFDQHDVTILELNSDPRLLSHLPKALARNIQRIDSETVAQWPFRGIGLSDVRSFKGLESNVICLVGARGLGSVEEVRNMLYVAMSRARALLWIANTPEFDDSVQAVMGDVT